MAITKEFALLLTSLLPRAASEPGGIFNLGWRFIWANCHLQGSGVVPLIDACGLESTLNSHHGSDRFPRSVRKVVADSQDR